MYKKAVAALVFAEIIFGILCLGLLLTNEEEQPLEKTVFEVELNRVMLANEKEYMVEISGVRSSEQRILTYAVLDKVQEEVVDIIALSLEDYENLLRIVEAEAGGEDNESWQRLLSAVASFSCIISCSPEKTKRKQRKKGNLR